MEILHNIIGHEKMSAFQARAYNTRDREPVAGPSSCQNAASVGASDAVLTVRVLWASWGNGNTHKN